MVSCFIFEFVDSVVRSQKLGNLKMATSATSITTVDCWKKKKYSLILPVDY